MANNEDDIKIVFGAEADESSAEQTGKKLRKSVEKSQDTVVYKNFIYLLSVQPFCTFKDWKNVANYSRQ